MRSFRIALSLALLTCLAACSDDGDTTPKPDTARAPGTVGGPCYGNKTCNAGLVCLSDLCVRPNDLGPGKKDGPVAKKDGPVAKKDGPVAKKDGPAGKYDGLIAKKDGPGAQKDMASPDAWKLCKSGCVATVAGSGLAGFKDGPTLKAQLKGPTGVALSPTGVLYIADRYNHRIRKLDKGVVSTFAGSGIKGYKDGPASAAQFNEPYDLALGPKNTLYVVDRSNHRVRAISTGIVTTVAGSGQQGFADGAASTAKLNFPTGLSVNPGGAIYLADKSNNRIRLISGNKVSTFAGSGAAGLTDGALMVAKFKSPYDIALAGPTTAYVADATNNAIRLISNTKVTTLAGDGVKGYVNGLAKSARFSGPGSVAAGVAGKVYVSDYGNSAIRVIAAGNVITLAGTGAKGFLDGPLNTALFNHPGGIVVDGIGRVYVADAGNNRIRLVVP